MRVLIDSSVWVDFFNDYDSPVTDELDRLFDDSVELCTCGPVVMEVAQGLKGPRTRKQVLAVLAELTFLELTGSEPYLRAAELYRELRARGRTIRSAVDCLLVATAESHGCFVLARDRDLEAILGSGLARCQPWSRDQGEWIHEGS